MAADPGAVVLLPYSSGTTGLPKGVMLTHANLVTMLRQTNRGLQVTGRDTLLAVPPFFHVMGFVATLALSLASGATGATMPDRRSGTAAGSVGRVMPNTELRVVDPRPGATSAAARPASSGSAGRR